MKGKQSRFVGRPETPDVEVAAQAQEASHEYDASVKKWVRDARNGKGARVWAHGAAGTYHCFAQAKANKWISLCGWYERATTESDGRAQTEQCRECLKFC